MSHTAEASRLTRLQRRFRAQARRNHERHLEQLTTREELARVVTHGISFEGMKYPRLRSC